MIKFDSQQKDLETKINFMLESLPVKKIIYCNHGIGDFIVCSRIAKFIGCGVLQTVCNDMIYRKEFCKELADIEKITRIELPLCRNNKLAEKIKNKYKNEIIHEYNSPKLYYFSKAKNQDEFMFEALSTKFNVEYQPKIKNLVFICPSGSGSEPDYRRHLYKYELDLIIEKLKSINKTVFLIGIEKDIKNYGFYENVKWVNSSSIITENEKIEINLEKFIKIISCAEKTISVNTYFHLLSSVLGIETYVIHSTNKKNESVITRENEIFFLNMSWSKNKVIATMPEILNMIS
jgi:hypothetical protein